MSTRAAVILFAVIAGLIALDLYQGWGGTVFAGQKLLALINFLTFWR